MYAWCVRFLGIDYGRRRIGLALSDASGTLARPWKTIARQGNLSQVATAITALVTDLINEDDRLEGVVLGWPRALGGEATEQTAEVAALAAALRARIEVPLVLQDERLSSREAESLLARRVKNWRDRKPLLDAAAAAVILQDFLDHRSAPAPLDPLDSLEDHRS
jgi:putative holliday junction resolvase